MEPGSLVRAVYEFKSDVPGELSFKVNDAIQIDSVIDRFWLRGVQGERIGNFPRSYVSEIDIAILSEVQNGQSLFVTSETFPGGEAGDLPFSRGELIIGISPVDSNWWHGRNIAGCTGIFPVTHAWKVDMSKLVGNDRNDLGNVYAIVKLDMDARLEEEINLRKGDIVKITEKIDKDWFRGECNGRSGIFPSGFVEIKEDLLPNANIVSNQATSCDLDNMNESPQITLQSYNNSNVYAASNTLPALVVNSNGHLSSHAQMNTLNVPTESSQLGYHEDNVSGITAYGRALFSFYAQNPDELSFTCGELIKLNHYVDSQWIEGEIEGKCGLVPCNYIDIIVDCPGSRLSFDSNTSDLFPVDDMYSAFPDGTVATLLFDFVAQTDEDLDLRKGERITLLRKIDKDWYLAKNNSGRIGICPSNYVEIQSNDQQHLRKSVHSNNCVSNFGEYSQQAPRQTNFSKEVDPEFDESIARYVAKIKSECTKDSAKTIMRSTSLVTNYGNRQHVSPTTNRQPPILPPKTYLDKADDTNIKSLNDKDITNTASNDCVDIPKSMSLYAVPEKKSTVWFVGGKAGDIKESNLSAKVPSRPAPPAPLNDLTPKRCHAPIKDDVDYMGISTENKFGQLDDENAVADTEVTINSEETRKKNFEKRKKVIGELISSEKYYLKGMKVCYDTFLKNTEKTQAAGIDTEALFGNFDEIIGVSENLLDLLETNINNKSEEKQTIGLCFQEVADDMKQAYGHYSSNYDEVIALLKKYNSCPGIKAYLDNGVAKIKREQNCFNLASILIMPIQRILKFPLLLNQLKMCTEDDHPDKIELQRAFDLMTDVATTINEAKRRRDLVFKYRRESPSSLSSRLSKLNLHSVKKKSARIGLKLSSTIGIYSATKDESFDECEQRFRFLEKTVKVFLKDIHLFCDQMQECILMQSSLAESIADIYVEKVSLREVNEYRTVQKKIAENYWDEFKLAVANNVCVPINKLQNLFTGPINIIQKRHDKLLDYDNYTSKLEKYKDVSKLKTMKEEQQLAKSNYEALNTQLLDELPMLINASLEILKTCISVFILARKLIIGKITRSMLTLMELPLLVSSKGDIVQNFIMKHNVVAAKIKDIQLSSSKVVLQPVTVNTLSRSKDKGPKPAVRSENTLPGLLNQVAREQLPSERTFVLSKYQPNDIYVMSSAYIASNVMDLSIGAGTIVGVIIRKDPMGSESRWFVDIGHLKGFVTSNSLEPYVPANSGSPPSYNTVVSSGYQQVQSHTDSSLLMSLSPTEESQRRRMSRAVGDFDPLATAGRSVVSANHPSPQDPFSPTVHHNPIANERINNTNVEQAQHGMMRRPTDGTSATTDKTPDNISRFGQPAVPSRLQTGYENISKYDVKLAFGQASHHDYTKPCEDRYDFVSDDVGNDDHRYEVVPEDHRYEIPDDRYDYVSDDVNQQQSEYYYAVFPFSSNGVNMLTLSSGQVVNILHKKDTDGNSDWWFVEDRYGNQGYVPAIYLKPYDL